MKNQKLKQKVNDDIQQIYFDAFSKVIQEQKIDIVKRGEQISDEQFTLFDDLQIILKLYPLPKVSQKNFQELSHILKRSNISIKNRYQVYLQNLTSQDFQNIHQFVQKYGIFGQLNFYLLNENYYQLKSISAIVESPIYYLLGTPKKQAINEGQSEKNNQNIKIKDQIQDNPEPIVQKKIKQNIKFQLSATSKYDKSNQKQRPFHYEQTTILDREQKQKAEELKFTLKLLSNFLNVSYKELVVRMYQCSGDLNILLRVFYNNQESLLWTKEADEALNDYLKQIDNLEKQKLIAVLNGEEQILKRKEWLFG